MKRALVTGFAALVVAFVAIQFVPVDTENPPVEADIDTPSEVKAILRRSCYDCHSNETRWPWYSRVAPFSWLVSYDVAEGREELNFSTWSKLSTREQVERMEESWETVSEGEMPLWYYLPAHPEARISASDRDALRAWVRTGTSRVQPDGAERDDE
jgi:hypothetical protein